MNVRRLKQIVGIAGAWAVAAGVVVVLGLAALSVVHAGTGADPADAFTDPAAQMGFGGIEWADTRTTAAVDTRSRLGIESAWRTVLDIRSGRDVDASALATELRPALVSASDTPASSAGGSRLEVRRIGAGEQFVQVSAEVEIATTIDGTTTTAYERYDLTLVRQPSGWLVVSLQRLGAPGLVGATS